AVLLEADGCGVASRASVELPEQLAGPGFVGVEVAVSLAGEGEPARSRQRPAHHRLGNLVLPGDLPSLEVDRGEEAILLFTRNAHEGTAQPEASFFQRGRMGDVVHRLMQPGHEGVSQPRTHRYGRPLGAA